MGATHRALAALRALDLREAIAGVQHSPTLSHREKDDIIARLDILVEIAQRHDAGESLAKICRELGLSTASLFRWLRAFQKSDLSALAGNYSHCGRRPAFTFTRSEEEDFQKIFLGTNRHHGNATLAMKIFAEKHPALAQFLARQKSASNQPVAVRTAIAKLRAKP